MSALHFESHLQPPPKAHPVSRQAASLQAARARLPKQGRAGENQLKSPPASASLPSGHLGTRVLILERELVAVG